MSYVDFSVNNFVQPVNKCSSSGSAFDIGARDSKKAKIRRLNVCKRVFFNPVLEAAAWRAGRHECDRTPYSPFFTPHLYRRPHHC